jgi:pimeloyl-ACP methyl ester carboxylesterase
MLRVFCAVLLCSCTAPDLYRSRRPPPAESIVVLVPGYRGSFLYEGEHPLYLTPGEALSRGSRSLGTCDAGLLPLQPGGPMTRFTIFPYVMDVYDGLMVWGRDQLPGFTAFGYDWRQDLTVTARELCDFIGPRRAKIIAHSMGGLVTLLAAQQCGAQFDAVAFAGVPFRGSPGIFDDLFLGTVSARNTALLSAPALWTFSSSWQLLPRSDDFFVDAEGAPVTVPISDPATWKAWALPCPALLEARLADRQKMPPSFDAPTAPALAIIGRGRPTIAAMRRQGDFFDFDQPSKRDGDGTVLTDNAAPPFSAQQLFTEYEHQTLLNDPQVRDAIALFFNGIGR